MTRPECLHCGRPLRRYRWRNTDFNAGKGREWGNYGDNLFCGLTCGYNWACAHVKKVEKQIESFSTNP